MCLQKPYLGGKRMAKPAYEFRFGYKGERRQQRVTIGLKKDLGGIIIVETRLDLIEYSYIQVIDIWELNSQRKKKRETRIVKSRIIVSEKDNHGVELEMSEEELWRTLIGISS